MTSVEEEADRLFEILNADDLPLVIATSGLNAFSDASKNAVVARAARSFVPAPAGHLLGRLHMIRTDENKADMQTAFLANLRSPYPDARRASLRGLGELDYPGFTDLAILSLRDDTDEVLVTACDLLLPQAKDDPHLWKILQDVYAMHKGDPRFHMTMSLLEAHGIAQ
jgi:hypothetical protein